MGTVSNQRGLVHQPKAVMSCQVGGRGAGGVLFLIQWFNGTIRTKIEVCEGGRERGPGRVEEGGKRRESGEGPRSHNTVDYRAPQRGGERVSLFPNGKKNNGHRWQAGCV